VGKNFAVVIFSWDPQDHSRVSNINFDFKTNEEGGSIDIP
jgi:hypothetical protein